MSARRGRWPPWLSMSSSGVGSDHSNTGDCMAVLRFFLWLFALIGFAIVILGVGIGILVNQRLAGQPDLPNTVVLELDLRQPLREVSQDVPLPLSAVGLRDDLSLRDVVEILDRAAGDPRVRGAMLLLGSETPELAQAQEIRAAIDRFRGDGDRFVHAFADTFGEFGPGNVPYYLASAADQVWLQPIGMVGLTGVYSEVPFAREALAELSLQPQIGKRGDYKTIANIATERDFTEAHREMQESLVNELADQLVAGIADGRGLELQRVAALLDRGPLLAEEALEGGLIDRLGYVDEAEAAALDQAGQQARLIGAGDYLRATETPGDGPVIALIVGTGAIQRGDDEASILFGGEVMAADRMVEAFEAAIEDPQVEAIVFRIASPGGSAVASETIRRAVLRAREVGKPVIVSMSGAAASGGYWVAMDADRIIALPATLTGSIGVVAGKIVAEGLWEDLGVSWGAVGRGENAAIWSSRTPYDPGEAARLDAMLDHTYEAFVTNVAGARGLTPEAVDTIAQGRVWTGSQAVSLGLVDALGGYAEAFAAARMEAGLPADAAVTVRRYPAPEPAWQLVRELLAGERFAVARLQAELEPVLARLRPLVEAGREDAILRMPEVGTIR